MTKDAHDAEAEQLFPVAMVALPTCLHCAVQNLIGAHREAYGAVSMGEVMSLAMQLAADCVVQLPQEKRTKAKREMLADFRDYVKRKMEAQAADPHGLANATPEGRA